MHGALFCGTLTSVFDKVKIPRVLKSKLIKAVKEYWKPYLYIPYGLVINALGPPHYLENVENVLNEQKKELNRERLSFLLVHLCWWMLLLFFLMIVDQRKVNLWLERLEASIKSLILRQVCCCSVTKSCPTLCDPVNCSTPGFPVIHYLLEFAQTHDHWVGDAIQPSHPLLLPSHTQWVFFTRQKLWTKLTHIFRNGQ